MNGTAASYFVGFALALVLSLIPFGIVVHGGLQRETALVAIGGLAVLQVIVQLHYFLHIDPRWTSTEMFVALVFALVLIDLMVGGSIWIMFDLHRRMAM